MQAQDEEEFVLEVNGNTGDWTKASSPAYGNEWTSVFKELGTNVIIREPQGVNNMNLYDGINIQFYNSQGSSGQSRTYDILVSNVGYYIAGVSFEFKPGKHPNYAICPMSVKIEDTEAYAEVDETVTFEYTNDLSDVTKVTMTVSSDDASHHAFAATKNFKVTLKKRPGLDAAWDRLNSIVASYSADGDAFVTDGTPGSYGAAEKEAYLAAIDYVHQMENIPAEELTEAILDEHGQTVIQTYDALIASKNMTYDVPDGYYRIRTAMDYNDGNVKYLYSYFQENGGYYYALWATPEDGDKTDQIAVLWKISKKDKGYDVQGMLYPDYRFIPIAQGSLSSGSNKVYRMLDNSTEVLVFDPAVTIDGTTYFNIRCSKDKGTDGTYFHQNGHASGGGTSGLIIAWNPTYTLANPVIAASEWYLEPVDDSEAAQIISDYEPIRAQKELTKAYNELKTIAQTEISEAKELVLGEALLTDGSQFSSPFSQNDHGDPDGGNLADGVLIDGDTNSYWHSTWTNGNVENHTHYLQVSLPEGDFSDLRLTFTRRKAGSDHVTKWSVYGCNDSEAADGEWVRLAAFDTPYGNNTETLSRDFNCMGYKYLRFYIDGTTTNKGFGHMSEFQLYELSQASTSQFAIIGEPAQNLENVLKEQTDINADEVTQEQYDALKNAYDAFKAQYVDPTELRDLIARAEAVADGIVIGTNPGTWSSDGVGGQLQQVVTEAKAYDEAKIYVQATSQNYINTITELLDGVLDAANNIQEGKWYRIRFGSEAAFEEHGWDKVAGEAVVSEEDESVQDEALWDKYVVAAKAEENDGVRTVIPIYADEARLGNGLFVDDDADIEEKELSQFRFIAVGDTAYMIQNRGTGLFVKAAGATGDMTLDLHPTLFNVTAIGYGFNAIAAKSLEGAKQNYIHIQRSNNKVVTWDASTVGSRSALLIEEVGDAAGYTEPGFSMDVFAGALYAMCYPVDITVEEGSGQLYSVEKVEGLHVTFAPIEKAEAGQPFVYVFGDVENFDPENTGDVVKLHHGYDLAPKPLEGETFAGTYVQKTLGGGYIVTGKALRDIGGIYAGEYALNELFITRDLITNGVNAHGAYIIPEEGATGAVTFDFGGTEDGIVEVVKNISRTGNIYSIDGRLVGRGNINSLSGMNKGVYIINGTKVVVK